VFFILFYFYFFKEKRVGRGNLGVIPHPGRYHMSHEGPVGKADNPARQL
jgi:hypothetical protein